MHTCKYERTNARSRGMGGRVLAALFAAVLLLLFSGASAAQAKDLGSEEVPPELAPWIPWVTAQLGDQVCAPLFGRRICQWPGRLELELDDQGGSFRLLVQMDAPGLRTIVGGKGTWPQDVRVDQKRVPVLSISKSPTVELTAGLHEIVGTFSFSELPETLEIGADTAFIELEVFGKEVPLVKREGSKVWLKGLSTETSSEQQPERVELSVFRRINDGIPLEIETRLVFQVAGGAREITLPSPLLPETHPLRVESDLALALEPSGDLRVQLLPGRHEVVLLARHVVLEGALRNVKRTAPWPEREIWTFHPNPVLRAVEVSGLPGIDASRTELPQAWRDDSAYVANADAIFKIETTRRGQEQVPNNQLTIQREFWLDEDGDAYTVRDQLQGEMHHGFRLNLLSGHLGNVESGGESQVITRYEDKTGVEVRDGSLSLAAVSRVPRTKSLRAVGWSEDAQSLSAQVHLPPGWDVLLVSGVDEASRTWLGRWDLFDVFYLLVVSFGMWRLLGPGAGLTAAAALLLSHGENDAPEYLWLPLIVLAALCSVLSPGRIRTWLSLSFWALGMLTIIILVAFSVQQVKQALYPHLDHHFGSTTDFDDFLPRPAEAPPPPPDAPQERQEVATDAESERMEDDALDEEPVSEALEEARPELKVRQKRQSITMSRGPGRASADDSSLAGSLGAYDAQKQFHPDAVAQTGPGVPEASGTSIRLHWTGPVASAHDMSLYLLPPAVSRLLTVLRLCALWALFYLLFRFVRKKGSSPGRRFSGATTSALLFVAFSSFVALPARADQPSDARLAELKERLTQPPSCTPHCISVSRMKVVLDDDLKFEIRVNAGAQAVYKLPGPANDLIVRGIQVDGQSATALRMESDGAYYLRLEEGVHEVILDARLIRDRVTLDVGTPPERIEVDSNGWSVSGVSDEGLAPGGTLTFQRDASLVNEGNASEEQPTQVAVPPFFMVERRISLGVTALLTTKVVRMSDASSPEVLRLPLIPGEQLTTPGIETRDGKAEISFPREETARVLVSTLPLVDDKEPFELELMAPEAKNRTETWLIDCSVMYHCRVDGLVPTSRKSAGHALFTFHPFPLEKLKLTATQPKPVDGPSLTVHQATLTEHPGTRTGKSTLQMVVQTSRSVVHSVTIPEDASLVSVKVDGVDQAVKSQNGNVRISLSPGRSHVQLEWRKNSGLGAWFTSGGVHTGAPSVNLRSIVELPPERWLLFAGGPSQGPALLFWGYLVLIIVASALLSRVPYSPLKAPQWLLLGIGLTQVPAAIAVFVAGWFFAIAARRHLPHFGRNRRNLLQLALVLYTVSFLLSLAGAVYGGLISSPDMEVHGAGSYSGHLSWYRDRSDGALPQVWVLSLNLWIWRAFMLAWALWLSRSLLSWLKWAWNELNEGGFWVPAEKKPHRRAAESPPGPSGPTPPEPSEHEQRSLVPDDSEREQPPSENASLDETEHDKPK